MSRNTSGILSIGASLALFTLGMGCGVTDSNEGSADETSDGSGESAGETNGDGDGDCEHAANPDGAADGATCTTNSDCMSNLCVAFSDAPADATAVCEAAPAACNTRITGTVFDFVSGAPVGDLDVTIAGAIAASVNPTNVANPVASGAVGADGTFDLVSDQRIEQPLGIVAIITGGAYHLSATGLASPEDMNFYGPGTSIHDVWTVATSDLDGWNTLLAADTALTDFLPLGFEGGVIGMARDEVAGTPMAGIGVASQDDGSGALIRYLNEAGDAFDGTETGSSGLFIIVDPGLGENFDALRGGTVIDGVEGTAGSTPDSLFIMILDVPAP